MKIYIIYCDFKATSGNHAGMTHLVNHLNNNIHEVIPVQSKTTEVWEYRWVKLYAIWTGVYLFFKLRKKDKVFFFEYLTIGHGYQHFTARVLRLLGKRNPLYALVHLSESHLMEFYGGIKLITSALRPIDKIFTFGSKLSDFLKKIVPDKEVITTFHYVDNQYYTRDSLITNEGPLNVIFVGNLKRNFLQLKEVVLQSTPDIQFHICMGKSDADIGLKSQPNVHLYGYLVEDELLELMQKCDASLSVMEDTVGSNAITTGFATGLVQIVSNVGSILDYCDESDSFLCNSTGDFLRALHILNNDRLLLNEMQRKARQKADEISVDSFVRQFRAFMELTR